MGGRIRHQPLPPLVQLLQDAAHPLLARNVAHHVHSALGLIEIQLKALEKGGGGRAAGGAVGGWAAAAAAAAAAVAALERCRAACCAPLRFSVPTEPLEGKGCRSSGRGEQGAESRRAGVRPCSSAGPAQTATASSCASPWRPAAGGARQKSRNSDCQPVKARSLSTRHGRQGEGIHPPALIRTSQSLIRPAPEQLRAVGVLGVVQVRQGPIRALRGACGPIWGIS